ncbi:MAG: glycoside hydrolase family 2 TIM barrel-domain containing protein [Alistipes sp.]|nr:glycoside hydrolase family 2 TIM barrel-domain containing protein [Alistipes sp.]
MKKLFICFILCTAGTLSAQVWNDPSIGGEGKANPRPEFISYATRKAADLGKPSEAPHYVPLDGTWHAILSTTREGGEPGFYRPGFSSSRWKEINLPNLSTGASKANWNSLLPPQLPSEVPLIQYRTAIDVPYLWLDRDMFIHIEGVGGAYTLYVNGQRIGYNNDSRTPTEFEISKAVTDGINSIGIEVYGYSSGYWMESALPQVDPGTLGQIYVYSQPKLRIEDFVFRRQADTTGVHGWVDFAVVMSNSYRTPEKITLGYDVYSPAGKLLTYNLIETEIPGESTDTLTYREILYHVIKSSCWTPAHPELFKLMLYTRRDGRITEYIPLTFGFNLSELHDDGTLWINGKPAALTPLRYNAARDKATTERELRAMKSQKINTLCPDYPQPGWFYDLCDRIGFYVIDQANINAGFRTEDRNVGGSVVNNPAFLPQFIDRVAAMQGRTKNYTSIIALSMGGACGNGYNLYKSYQWLKAADSLHVVTYRDVQGEWNSDWEYPQQKTSSVSHTSVSSASQSKSGSKSTASKSRR